MPEALNMGMQVNPEDVSWKNSWSQRAGELALRAAQAVGTGQVGAAYGSRVHVKPVRPGLKLPEPVHEYHVEIKKMSFLGASG